MAMLALATGIVMAASIWAFEMVRSEICLMTPAEWREFAFPETVLEFSILIFLMGELFSSQLRNVKNSRHFLLSPFLVAIGTIVFTIYKCIIIYIFEVFFVKSGGSKNSGDGSPYFILGILAIPVMTAMFAPWVYFPIGFVYSMVAARILNNPSPSQNHNSGELSSGTSQS